MSLAKQLYDEACDYLEQAGQKDRSKMEPKARELHDAYIAYYTTIKEEIVNSTMASPEENQQQAAKRLIKLGMSTHLISKTTGLEYYDIELLRPKKKKN